MAKDAVTQAYADSLKQSQPWIFNLMSSGICTGRVLRVSAGVAPSDNVYVYDIVILDQDNNEINLNESGTGNPVRPYLCFVRSSIAMPVGSIVQVSRGVSSSGVTGAIEVGDTEDYQQFCASMGHKILPGGGGGSCFQSYTEWGAFFG